MKTKKVKNTKIIIIFFMLFLTSVAKLQAQMSGSPIEIEGTLTYIENEINNNALLLTLIQSKQPEIMEIINNTDEGIKNSVKITISYDILAQTVGITDFDVDSATFVEQLKYTDILDLYMNERGYSDSIKQNIKDFIGENQQLKDLYKKTIDSFNPLQLITIFKNPADILNYTTNAAALSFMGTSLLYMEAVNGNYQIASKAVDRLKTKFANISTAGENYGLLIPMYFPLGSLGINVYSDFPTDINKLSASDKDISSGNYDVVLDAIDAVPLPYLQLVGQVNTWTAPISLGFRVGALLGFDQLYKMFITDLDIQSFGFHAGLEFKTLIYRNSWFFTDFRLSANYDMGYLDFGFNNTFYYGIQMGEDKVDTGLVFNGDFRSKTKWHTVSLSPKLTLGFKSQEKIPYIHYFALYFSGGVDLTYGLLSYQGDIKFPYIYANIAGNNDIIKDLVAPIAQSKGDYFYYDYKVSATLDIFYQSLTVEYYIRSKNFAITFMPFIFKF